MAPGTSGAGAQETPDAKSGAERQDKTAPKTKSSQKPANDKGSKSSDSKSGQAPANKRESVDKGSRTGPAKAEQTPAKREGSTTGQGPAGQSGASLTAEQRTKITTVIKQRNVKPVTNVNFSISVGAVVPASVHYYPLPVEVVEVYPEWRGYLYILVGGGDILVIHPQTHRIVAVIEA